MFASVSPFSAFSPPTCLTDFSCCDPPAFCIAYQCAFAHRAFEFSPSDPVRDKRSSTESSEANDSSEARRCFRKASSCFDSKTSPVPAPSGAGDSGLREDADGVVLLQLSTRSSSDRFRLSDVMTPKIDLCCALPGIVSSSSGMLSKAGGVLTAKS
eukprot:3093306-Rhodomonas_salina.1